MNRNCTHCTTCYGHEQRVVIIDEYFVVPYDIRPTYLLRFYEISTEVFSNFTPALP